MGSEMCIRDRYHFVVSHQDPRVANWLDPAGVTSIVVFLRWQGMGNLTVFPAPDYPTVKEVDFDSIRNEPPFSEQSAFGPRKRKDQLALHQKAGLTKPRGF